MRPSHAQRAQQVAHEGGLAGAQVAVQLDAGVAQAAARRQANCAKAAVAARPPGQGDARGGRVSRIDRHASFAGAWSIDGSDRCPVDAGAGLGAWSWDSPRSASPASTCHERRSPGLLAWLDAGFHGAWTTWPRTA
jgi:hypothetical protein